MEIALSRVSHIKTVIALDSLLSQCVQAHFDLIDRRKIGECPPVSLNVNRDLDTTGMGFDLPKVLSELVLTHQLSNTQLELMVRVRFYLKILMLSLNWKS